MPSNDVDFPEFSQVTRSALLTLIRVPDYSKSAGVKAISGESKAIVLSSHSE